MSMPFTLPVKIIREGALAPTKAHATDAGYDLYSAEEVRLGYDDTDGTMETDIQLKLYKPIVRPAQSHAIVKTGIAVAIPEGYYGRVAPRSGLSVKHCVEVGAGVVDSGYRGEIMVHLYSHGGKRLHIVPGDRIAQLIITTCASPVIQTVDMLPSSDRGAVDFGSSSK